MNGGRDPTIPVVAMTVVAVVVLGICMVMVLGDDNGAQAKPTAKREAPSPHLQVDKVYFELVSPSQTVEGETSDLTIHAIITNNGLGNASNVAIWASMVDTDSNLVVTFIDKMVGGMAVNTTVQVPIEVTVANGHTYRVELMIRERAMLRVTGQASITLGSGAKPAGTEYQTTDDDGSPYWDTRTGAVVNETAANLRNHEGEGEVEDRAKASLGLDLGSSEGSSSAAAGLGLMMLLVVAVAALMVARWRRALAAGRSPQAG